MFLSRPASLLLLLFVGQAHADPTQLLGAFTEQARQADAAFQGFDAQRGASFFKTVHGDWSCSSCHTENPAAPGKHIVTGKSIEAMAPAANPKRFSDLAKTEKWFRRNCNDVLKRSCTAQEKGDVLSYLITVKN